MMIIVFLTDSRLVLLRLQRRSIGNYKCVYFTTAKLQSPNTSESLLFICLFVCLRSRFPDYKLLGILKRQFPKVPLIGLTATATSSVLKDCQTILSVPQPVTLKASFNRPNLFYEVAAMATHTHTHTHTHL